jgi:hypothetical protein
LTQMPKQQLGVKIEHKARVFFGRRRSKWVSVHESMRRCKIERGTDGGFGHRACVRGFVRDGRDDDRECDDKEIE